MNHPRVARFCTVAAMRTRVTAIIACLLAALALGACSEDSSGEDSRSIDLRTETTNLTEDTAASSTTTDEASGQGGDGSTATDTVPFDGHTASYDLARTALTTAAGAVPDGMPFDLDIDHDDAPIFEIKVASAGAEYEIDIDITGERVLSTGRESDPDDEVAKVGAAAMDAVTALGRAEELHPDARVEEIEIDRKDSGIVVWEFDLRGPNGEEIDLDLDASSGEVVQG